MQICALNSQPTKFSCTNRTTQRPKHPTGRTLMHRWAPLLAASGAAAAGGLVATQTPLWGTSGKGSNPEPMMADVVPSRSQQLMRLRDNKVEKPYDVLIIGGGATGTGCAWDAATRGLRTALVEREDFASGTSSKSTKLVHGGVRYLEKAVMGADVGQFKLVYEALHERKVFLENAPHLSRPLPILMPCYKWWEVPYYWAGMKAYDLVAGRGNLIWSKYVGPTEATELMPTLATQLDGRSLKGAIMYYDGQFDDSRMAVTMACSAAAAGAATLNYMEASKIIKNDEGKVVGVKCRDRLTGEEVDVHARVVINATGPFLDGVRHLADPKAPQSVTASKGAHITLPGYLGSSTHGIIIPKTPDGRVVFLLPWQDHLVAGTTDSEHEVTNDLRTTEEEVSYILTTISNYLGIRITPSDVLSSWSGIRPLPSSGASKAKDTQSVVRDHVIFMDDDGLLNVTGGKWTTFRRMAEEVIDAAVASGRLPMNIKPCITEHHPVMGATAFKKTTFAEVAQNFLAAHSTNGTVSTYTAGPVSLPTLHHLVQSYGDRAAQILALAEKPGLSQPLVSGHPYIQAEVVYCVQNEYCMSAEDFLARRTRLAFLDVRAAKAAVPTVVALMAPLRNWDEQAKQQQIAAAEAFLNQTFTPGPEPTTVQPLQEPALIKA